MKMRAKYSEVYWECHPGGIYVSIWLKSDFFKMDIIDFMAKYLDEMDNPNTSEHRSKIIASIVLPMYKEITGKEYQNVDLKELIND